MELTSRLMALGVLVASATSGVSAATITVDTLDDAVPSNTADGNCSLREALQAAAQNQSVDNCAAGDGNDRIEISPLLVPADPSLPFSVMLDNTRLTLAGAGQVELVGPTARRLTIDAGQQSTVLNLGADEGTDILLENLRIINGDGSPGGVRLRDGVGLTIRNVGFENNQGPGRGGALGGDIVGVLNLQIEDSEFVGNNAGSFGGAIGLAAFAAQTELNIRVTRTLFDANDTGPFGRGGAVNLLVSNTDASAYFELTDSAVTNNVAEVDSGGLDISGMGSADTLRVALERNLFLGNRTGDNSGGGAARISSGNVSITNNFWLANEAGTAGALRLQNFDASVDRQLVLEGNTFFHNRSLQAQSSIDQMLVSFHPSVGSDNRLRGNVFVAPSMTDHDGCLVSNQTFADSWGHNLSDEASCATAASDVMVADAGVELVSVDADIVNQLPQPQINSPVIDAWPVNDCPLTDDLRGGSRPNDGDASGAAQCDIGAIEADVGVLLDASTAGDGSGRIVSIPTAIDCGTQCQAAFPENSRVTLIAIADSGNQFDEWAGACSGATGVCDVVMTQTQILRAAFSPATTATLRASSSGPGLLVSTPMGIYCQPVCEAAFVQGSTVQLVAVPEPGAAFSWSDDCSGTLGDTCQLQMTANRRAAVSFVETDFGLEVTALGTGTGSVVSTPDGINCPNDCNESFPAGTQVNLVATPAPGNVFAGWGGACSGVTDCVVAMNQARAVTAEFNELRRLSVTVEGMGSVVSDQGLIDCPDQCAADVERLTNVLLNAAPEPGWGFVEWVGCNGLIADPARCVVGMVEDRDITARFAQLAEQLFSDGFE